MGGMWTSRIRTRPGVPRLGPKGYQFWRQFGYSAHRQSFCLAQTTRRLGVTNTFHSSKEDLHSLPRLCCQGPRFYTRIQDIKANKNDNSLAKDTHIGQLKPVPKQTTVNYRFVLRFFWCLAQPVWTPPFGCLTAGAVVLA